MLIYGSLLIILSAIVGLTALDRRNLAYLYAFFLPFHGVTYEVGLQVNPEKMTCLYMLIFIGLFYDQFRFRSPVLGYMAVAIGVTVLMSFSLPPYADEFPLLRGRLRWVFQIVYLVMAFAPLHFIPSVLKTSADVSKLLQVFVLSCLLQACMGIAQYLVFQQTGVDIFPMSLFMGGAAELRTANFDFGDLRILRVCALGGEPKHLAYSLVVGLSVLLAQFYLNWANMRAAMFSACLCVCIFLTLSSQGLILMAATLLFVPFFLMMYARRVKAKALATLLAFALLFGYVWNFTFAGKLLQSRTVERITESKVGEGRGGIEDFDVIILSYFEDHPLALLSGLGIGNVHFHTRDYIPQELLYFADRNVYVSKKGGIRILSETGVIGFSAFLLMCGITLYNLHKKQVLNTEHLRIKNTLLVSSGCVLLFFMATCDGPIYYILFLSAAISFNRMVASSPAP